VRGDQITSKSVAFLDRDGVINELVFFKESGVIDSPFTPDLFKLKKNAAEGIRLLNEAGIKAIVTSNQPGMAKGKMDMATHKAISEKMRSELRKGGARLDGEHYCFHHPDAVVEAYRVICDCRKPKPGMILKAAKELGADLKNSWIVGDSISDIEAGKRAGCRTILIGDMKCELCRHMNARGVEPDAIAADLVEAARTIIGM
jgi:D-glycero-D-manno-heptose 1,7-bisphosphate phosphatase